MYGLIGKKLKHSYSKEIHEKLHEEKYNLIELNELDSFFQEKKFKGINITIPYKNDVIKYCDNLSETAIRTHSVNSIVN
ncbi:MAG: shikimate dehydrogenase, partial [Candidatus Izimaplasma sp.]|nr:shikimate dehydrogenase [Candidatus Izimaplasma bacterium]